MQPATLSNLRTQFIFFWKVRSLLKTNRSKLNFSHLTQLKTAQVLNPNFGDLQQLLQCCGKSAAFASEIATLVNTNAITGDIEKTIRERYVGNGKCEDPGISALMDKGNPTCSLLVINVKSVAVSTKNWGGNPAKTNEDYLSSPIGSCWNYLEGQMQPSRPNYLFLVFLLREIRPKLGPSEFKFRNLPGTII